MKAIKGSLFLVVLGMFIWLANMGYLAFWNWGRDWPWILIVIGLAGIFKHLFFRRRHHVSLKANIESKGARIAADIKKVVKDVVARVEKGEISAEKAAEKIREEERGTDAEEGE